MAQFVNKKYGSRSAQLKITPGLCYYCKNNLSEEDIYCPDCGFPQKKSQTEQRVFIGNKRRQVKELEELQKHQKGARQVLFLLAVFNFLGTIYYALSEQGFAAVIGQAVLTAVFAALWLWSKTKLRQATFTGIIIYITFIVLVGIFEPISMIEGLMIKVIIIFGLIMGYNSVKKAKGLEQEMEGKNLFNR